MLTFSGKTLIHSISLLGSAYMFSISLTSLGSIFMHKNDYKMNDTFMQSNVNKLMFFNGVAMAFSASAFVYIVIKN